MDFPLNKNTTLTINADCSVILSYWTHDEELEGFDWDKIELSQEEARKVAQILIEELG